MSGLVISMDARGIGIAEERLQRLARLDRADLLNKLGGLGAEQTKLRIAGEKRSPDGEPWKANLAGTSILYATGQNLHESISHDVSGDETEWGASFAYAAIHQFGGTIRPKNAKRLAFRIGNRSVFARSVTIPARPYLGVSHENAIEIEEALAAWIDERLAA